MHKARRIDANQTAIVKQFRKMGATVAITSSLGNGFPDLVLSIKRGTREPYTCLVEIKDGSKPPSARKLTPDEQAFHDSWQGNIAIVSSAEDASQLIWKALGLGGDKL